MDTFVPTLTTARSDEDPYFAENPQNDRYDLVEAVPDLRARLDAIIALAGHRADSTLFDPVTLLNGCRSHAERALALLDAAI